MPWTVISHTTLPYLGLEMDRNRGLLRMTRTSLSLPDSGLVETLKEFAKEMERVLPRPQRQMFRLLFDTRNAPKRSTSEQAELAQAEVTHFFRDFPRLAILLRTPIGVLQMRRIFRDSGLHGEVFYDEAAAIEYLLKAEPPSR